MKGGGGRGPTFGDAAERKCSRCLALPWPSPFAKSHAQRADTKISKGNNFPDSLGFTTGPRRRATKMTRQQPRLLKERARIKHACINRQCQSPVGQERGRRGFYLLAFDIRGPCRATPFPPSMDFHVEARQRCLETLEFNIHA